MTCWAVETVISSLRIVMNIPTSLEPTTLPLTVRHFQILVRGGAFEDQSGQIELIHGRIVRRNSQGPEHSDPIDEIQDWSYEHAGQLFRIRIEKPIEIAEQHSCPKPEIAWVRRDRYRNRHPQPSDVRLLIEVSSSSGEFDRTEKLELYAEAEIAEYWRVDMPTESVTVCRDSFGRTYRSIVTHRRDARSLLNVFRQRRWRSRDCFHRRVGAIFLCAGFLPCSMLPYRLVPTEIGINIGATSNCWQPRLTPKRLIGATHKPSGV